MKFLLITVLSLSSYFASANKAPVSIAPEAKAAFKIFFKEAIDAEWIEFGDIARVKFKYKSQLLYAFYNEQGELLCMGKSISFEQLPLALQFSFQKIFSGSEIIEAFEISDSDAVHYYVTIKSSNRKIILKSMGMTNWSVYSKTKRYCVN